MKQQQADQDGLRNKLETGRIWERETDGKARMKQKVYVSEWWLIEDATQESLPRAATTAIVVKSQDLHRTHETEFLCKLNCKTQEAEGTTKQRRNNRQTRKFAKEGLNRSVDSDKPRICRYAEEYERAGYILMQREMTCKSLFRWLLLWDIYQGVDFRKKWYVIACVSNISLWLSAIVIAVCKIWTFKHNHTLLG